MSDRSDLERDMAEEDELRSLLRAGDRHLVAPPIALIDARAARRRTTPLLGAVALALLVLVIGIGIGSARVAAPSTSPSPSTASAPAVATAVPQIGSQQPPSPGVCPEPPPPGYLPWPSSRGQISSELTKTERTWFGGASPATEPAVRVAFQLYAEAQPTTNRQTAGDRNVYVYFTSGQPTEARAWWREPSAVCPVVTAALVWPEKDRSIQQAELLRIVASIPSIAALPAATPRAASSYGFAVQQSSTRMQIVHEDGSVVATLDGVSGTPAVSADGRQVAYWGGANANELWIVELRDAQQRRKLLTLSNERGTGVVWSPTGKSLMFAAASLTFVPGPGGAPTYTALRVVGLDGSAPTELAHLATGREIRPLAWDETRGLGGAEEAFGQKGPGRYLLVSTHSVVESNGVTSNYRFIDLPDAQDPSVVIGPLQASSDARFVMATWDYPDRDLVRFWPIYGLDYGNARELTSEQAGDTLRSARWRPESLEIGVNVAGHLQLWTLDGQRRNIPAVSGLTSFTFRFDGMGVYFARVGSGQLGLIDLTAPSSEVRGLPAPTGPMMASVDLGQGP